MACPAVASAEAGSHTSKFTAGLITPTTRQESTGTWMICGFAVGDAVGTVNGPAATDVAARIIVSGIDSDWRLSHVAALIDRAVAATSALSMGGDGSRLGAVARVDHRLARRQRSTAGENSGYPGRLLRRILSPEARC